jgi:hypothetical protein
LGIAQVPLDSLEIPAFIEAFFELLAFEFRAAEAAHGLAQIVVAEVLARGLQAITHIHFFLLFLGLLLNVVLRQRIILSLHCPATPETLRLIGAEQIKKLQRGSILINTARGAIVDAAAIPPAIRCGQLAGAGIDVLPTEPPPNDDPLIVAWRDPQDPCHDRVIIGPHAAFYCEEGLKDIRVTTQAAR